MRERGKKKGCRKLAGSSGREKLVRTYGQDEKKIGIEERKMLLKGLATVREKDQAFEYASKKGGGVKGASLFREGKGILWLG